ncbi:hypothetical protein FTUN_1441 [Frigoriglobus tundricola]|uniref:Uncharacterized protein n=1 Tax=Frigoriglobus tundricola TaxID=2774151 RepID=A0A6M5YIQ6_9BACT|nr:hypothetical protein FTUN_1441 [Frigoriglobus tundricola]
MVVEGRKRKPRREPGLSAFWRAVTAAIIVRADPPAADTYQREGPPEGSS